MWHRRLFLIPVLTLVGVGMADPADAQVGRRLRDTATRAAERETARQIDRKVTEVVRCALEDQECIRRAEREGKQVEVTDRSGNVVQRESSAGAASAAVRPGNDVWANYDFVPGERVLFADDFSRDNIGDFPRRLQFVDGNMEIVEWRGQRLLGLNSRSGEFRIRLPETLPERFTIEFDYHSTGPHPVLQVVPGPAVNFGQDYPHTFVQVGGPHGTYGPVVNRFSTNLTGSAGTGLTRGSRASGQGRALQNTDRIFQRVVPIRIMADGSYLKMFVEEQRVANLPVADFQRANELRFLWYLGHASNQPTIYIGNFRIAAGGRKLYDALAAEGRVATQGILFDTGSEVIRPESTPTLREIGDMLRQHPQLRIRIEGHTDNAGQAAANQALSERRAAAVRQHLVQHYGIDASRLEAQGLGQSRPAASNDSPEGRQQNRRVELVRL